MNNLDNYAEAMGWVECSAEGGGDDLGGTEAESLGGRPRAVEGGGRLEGSSVEILISSTSYDL